jgi:dienelactone hydrolase
MAASSVILPVLVEDGEPGVGRLAGDLVLPEQARGVVLFAHGSGSSRHSPRNRAVARALNDNGFATLLLDLLTEDEEQVDLRTAALRFDIRLLAQRLALGVDWLGGQAATEELAVGLFGASTGAAAALVTASERAARVRAVVSRGGRPDLAGPALWRVTAPTLLIVGARDTQVLELNRQAATALAGANKTVVVPGATHLFEEPGALEKVAALAGEWFKEHFPT